MPVRVVPAAVEDMAVEVKAIGTVAPMNTVVVRSRVDGLLHSVLFQEGERVEAGEVLAEIDPEPFRVALAQAEGTLQQNLAQLKNAESDLAIYKRLFQQDSIARQQLDAQEALVNQLRGTLMTNRAQVDNAKLQLSYTKITAPIGGRLGLRRIDAGNLIASGDTEGLVTITQTQPIAVQFTVPEVQLADVRAAHRAGRLLAVEAWDRSERQMLAEGVLTTLDNQIDIATGTLRLKAQFENEDDALFPNQFVNVRLRVRTLEGAVTIPADAVQYGAQGTYVYMIVDGKATVRPVSLGPTSGGRIAVTESLTKGDEVVLEGLDRLREGREVTIVKEGGSGSPAQNTPAQRQNRGG
ncbi:HlyD family secretion protein [Oceanibaculum indicum P24]|uniref:HlyD family secretion protein n=1 Tax=Oceanibaculum indicum P24 TaxID=1207063 RepID=K2JJP5_9PROT|nr:HlyD family secretion protein [Oceanibaculum indicum P24]